MNIAARASHNARPHAMFGVCSGKGGSDGTWRQTPQRKELQRRIAGGEFRRRQPSRKGIVHRYLRQAADVSLAKPGCREPALAPGPKALSTRQWGSDCMFWVDSTHRVAVQHAWDPPSRGLPSAAWLAAWELGRQVTTTRAPSNGLPVAYSHAAPLIRQGMPRIGAVREEAATILPTVQGRLLSTRS